MREVGERSLLLEVDRPAAAARWIRSALPSLAEVVPAACTVLVVARSAADLPAAHEVLHRLPASFPAEDVSGALVSVAVRFDGPDLAAVASAVGRSVEQVVQELLGVTFAAEFCGFAPGFAYLSGLPDRLQLPRRADPRTRVPAGSFAVAGPFAAFYPRASPGGWNLLGATAAVLFDPDRDPASLITTGCRVRLEQA